MGGTENNNYPKRKNTTPGLWGEKRCGGTVGKEGYK